MDHITGGYGWSNQIETIMDSDIVMEMLFNTVHRDACYPTRSDMCYYSNCMMKLQGLSPSSSRNDKRTHPTTQHVSSTKPTGII
ncbi:hypothetical protein FRX31_017279 [Thalictrum thalictroides]|uniref:Uncharacterized protein n=1 Tax=Thalictrum thalictroides TaxID=46969 RepID=A0A7J6W6X1_THATH|nr:hypothetical protein FRX31_017279 [Thalictrum thalictroides]